MAEVKKKLNKIGEQIAYHVKSLTFLTITIEQKAKRKRVSFLGFTFAWLVFVSEMQIFFQFGSWGED